MHIGIDASRTTRAHVTGTERYALEIIRALIQLNDTLDAPHKITLYFNAAPPHGLLPHSQHVTQKVIPLARVWTHLRLAAELWLDRPDVVWVPAHGLPFVFPGRAVVTIHDLGYKHYPAAHRWRQRLALEVYTRFSAWRASVVMVDSRATQSDLHRYYGTPPEKMRVVYPGVQIPDVDTDIDAVRTKYGLPERYWLYLGTLQPRKNIARIVQAYQRWAARQTEQDTALVLAGGRGWKFDEAWVQGENVILPGYVDETDKGALYAGAVGFMFPSLYEGFGFPVVEAMGVGTPVVCSDTSSLPEVGGEAVLYAPPEDVVMIAAQMTRLSGSLKLRQLLVERGREQAAKFTWEDAAWDALLALEAAGAR